MKITLDEKDLQLLSLIFEFAQSELKNVLTGQGAVKLAVTWTQVEIERLEEKFSDSS